jgi:hypothetical protein
LAGRRDSGSQRHPVLNLKRLDDTSPTWTRIAVAPDGSILAKGSGSTSKESWATIAPTLKALKDD